MTLLYQPAARSVVICDFAGFVLPEMIKIRPVVVIAKHKHNEHLVTIVPLSTTAPRRLEAYHHAFMVNPLPDKVKLSCWAKCDMVATVSLSRLDRYKQPRGKFIVPQISEADFEALKTCVASALNLRHN